MIDYKYIEGVLGRFEGKAILLGYIPCRQGTWYPGGTDKGEILGQSGVSIGTGVDLGQQTEKGFAGLPESVLVKLRPYFGLRKQDAKSALERQPLTLTCEEVSWIDGLIHKRYIDETAKLFGFAFEVAPKQAQAVAVSLHYQFGTPARKESPALALAWEAMRYGSGRPARAIAAAIAKGEKPDPADVARLEEYEQKSVHLRSELNSLKSGVAG